MEDRFYEEYAVVQKEHWWFAGRRRVLQALLEGALAPNPAEPRRILDVGCGTGANLSELARLGAVEGVESSPAAVEICRRGPYRVTLASGTELPFADASFDVVTLLDVIEHVADDREPLAEARRVLRPGGAVLITVPAYTWMWGAQDEISHHYRRYTRPRLRASLEAAGLEPRRLTHFNTLLMPPIAAIRLARRFRPRPGELRSDFELNRPGPLNAVLGRILGLEASVLRHIDLPFGVSAAAVAARPRGLIGTGGPTTLAP